MKKQCTTCGEWKELEEFIKRKIIKSGLGSQCKVCRNEAMRKYREKDPEAYRESWGRYYVKNFDKVIEKCKQYCKNNPERNRIYKKKSIKFLADSYLRNKLGRDGIPITPEMIQIRREQIMVHRALKQLKEATNE